MPPIAARLLDGGVLAFSAGHGDSPLALSGEKPENTNWDRYCGLPRDAGLVPAPASTEAGTHQKVKGLGRWLHGYFYRMPLSSECNFNRDRHCYCPSRPQRLTLGALNLIPSLFVLVAFKKPLSEALTRTCSRGHGVRIRQPRQRAKLSFGNSSSALTESFAYESFPDCHRPISRIAILIFNLLCLARFLKPFQDSVYRLQEVLRLACLAAVILDEIPYLRRSEGLVESIEAVHYEVGKSSANGISVENRLVGFSLRAIIDKIAECANRHMQLAHFMLNLVSFPGKFLELAEG